MNDELVDHGLPYGVARENRLYLCAQQVVEDAVIAMNDVLNETGTYVEPSDVHNAARLAALAVIDTIVDVVGTDLTRRGKESPVALLRRLHRTVETGESAIIRERRPPT